MKPERWLTKFTSYDDSQDGKLIQLRAIVQQLRDVAMQWARISDFERRSWKTEWRHQMIELEHLERHHQEQRLSPQQEKWYNDILNTLEKHLSLIGELELYHPQVAPIKAARANQGQGAERTQQGTTRKPSRSGLWQVGNTSRGYSRSRRTTDSWSQKEGSVPSPQRYKPGEKAPQSGQYPIVGPRGGKTGEERTITKGDAFPPTPKPGQSYATPNKTKQRGKP